MVNPVAVLALERVSSRGRETLSRYANGMRAINGSPAFAPTPLASGPNVESPHYSGLGRTGRTECPLNAQRRTAGNYLRLPRRELSGSKLPRRGPLPTS